MANAQAQNYALASAGHSFSGVWKTTRVMKRAGWTVVAHSNGTTKQAAGNNANDSWGSNADPLADTYPAFDAAAAWIVMEGPQTARVRIAEEPTGEFIRGENCTQAVTGATGEVLGVVWDAGSETGWMNIAPRTGLFEDAQPIVGDASGASIEPVNTPDFLRRQVVFFKATNTTTGTILYVCFDDATESASSFSTLAASAGCTATIAPGCGGTGNGLPTIADVKRGTGGSVSHASWTSSSAPGSSAQIMGANATPSAGVSPDGSFACCLASATVGLIHCFGFFRVDDQEPGDSDPYVWFTPSAQTSGTYSRTARTGVGSGSAGIVWGDLYGGGFTYFTGNTARLCPVTVRDQTALYYLRTSLAYVSGSGKNVSSIAGSTTPRLLSHPSASPPFPRSNVELWCAAANAVHRKGVVRWMAEVPLGSPYATLDGGRWLVIMARNGSDSPGLAVGPCDGVTVPVQ